MLLTQHPEYQTYLADRRLVTAVREEMAGWSDEEARAWETAVSRLTALFADYNRVMWQDFPFCRRCLGGCCVVGASAVTPVDGAALAALDHDLPDLTARTHHSDHACIYLGETGCAWPVDWRPLKCMVFFSTGRGGWEMENEDAEYGRLTAALRTVLQKHLPDILGETGERLLDGLVEPVSFAAALSAALAARYFPEQWPENGRLPLPDPDANALRFIAEAGERLLADPDADEQMLADLARFQWIVTGKPAHSQEMLAEMNGRYQTGGAPARTAFSEQIRRYRPPERDER